MTTFNWTRIKPFLVFAIPLVILPLPLVINTSEARYAYCLIIIGLFWVLELLNLYVTCFLPMVLLPITGVASGSQLAKEYCSNTVMLLIGALMLACGIEKTGIHKRVALGTLKLLGSSTRLLMLGAMLVTWGLSMWITNTAATALMLPIIEQILEVFQTQNPGEVLPVGMTKGLSICTAYGANIGGLTTLAGTASNLVLANLMQEAYPCYEPKLNFTNWILYGLPISITIFVLAYLYLSTYWLGLPFFQKDNYSKLENDSIKKVIDSEFASLPPFHPSEKCVIFVFTSVIVLWFFSDPGFIPGWTALWTTDAKPSDSTVVLGMSAFMFFIPKNCEIKNFWNWDWSRPIITWHEFEKYAPWGTVIMVGSGLALSKASEWSGFSDYIADLLSSLETLPDELILFIIIVSVGMLTEITSNTATTNLIVPIILKLSEKINLNPIYLSLSATLACSMAFMLPVATPPNALTFGYGRVTVMDMVKCGAVMNLIGFASIGFFTIYYSPIIYNTDDTHPSWLNQTIC